MCASWSTGTLPASGASLFLARAMGSDVARLCPVHVLVVGGSCVLAFD